MKAHSHFCGNKKKGEEDLLFNRLTLPELGSGWLPPQLTPSIKAAVTRLSPRRCLRQKLSPRP